MYVLAQEADADWWEVEALFDTAFAPGRRHLSSYRLREDVEPIAPLCQVARDGSGTILGAIRYWPVLIDPRPVEPLHADRSQAASVQAALLGPVAVHPVAQGAGVGAHLLRETLALATDLGHERILLVGDAPYYSRFGFTRLQGVEMPPPTNPERLLGLALRPGAWAGICGTVVRAR